MKKLRFAGAALLALVLLAGCSTATPLAFKANWALDATLGDNLTNVEETLFYTVSYEKETVDGFSLDYTDGTFKTTLRTDLIESVNRVGYIFETELSVKVRFELNGEHTDYFMNTRTSHVEFLPAGNRLCPVFSYCEVHDYTPNAAPDVIANSYSEYRFRYETTYTAENDSAVSATVAYTDLLAETPETTTRDYDLKGDSSYLDNEQILFALRGVDFPSVPAFRSINTAMGVVQDVSLRQAASEIEESAEFTRDGEEVSENIPAYEISLGYGGSKSGMPSKLVYAKKADDARRNLNRNVLLRLEMPVMRGLGTLRYRLREAHFIQN